MPRRRLSRFRPSYCEAPDCPNLSGESGLCAEHDTKRLAEEARLFPSPDACPRCGDLHCETDRTECERCRHEVPDHSEESL